MSRRRSYDQPSPLCVTGGYDPQMWDYDGTLTLDNELACVICHHCPAYQWCNSEREKNPRLFEGTIRAATPIATAASLKKRHYAAVRTRS